MTLEDQIVELEAQRDQCLQDIEDEIHLGMTHLRLRVSPAQFVKRHLPASLATAILAGVLTPWLVARKAGPSRVSRGQSPHASRPEDSSQPPEDTTHVSAHGPARNLLGTILRTAAVEVASRVDFPALLSHFSKKRGKSAETDHRFDHKDE